MKKRFFGFLFAIGIIIFLSLMANNVFSVIQSSPLHQFNVSPDFVYLNWTNNYMSNINLTINSTFGNITLEILNGTSAVSANYSQINQLSQCQPGYYFLYVNISDGFNNTIGPLNAINHANSTANATISDNVDFNHLLCSPGRYWIQKFTIRNAILNDESANITVFIDTPISSNNNVNATTGIGSFVGTLPSNSSTYHSYYFNTSTIQNVTSVSINLTGWSSSQDADLFLFDNSGNLNVKSISKTATSESLSYNYIPSNQMWELRLYGNTTNTSGIPYTGYVIFNTLNVTDSSNQQVSSIDFGIMNASSTKQKDIGIKNEGSISSTNIQEYKEIYYTKNFNGTNAQNFTFLVPDSSIASKIKISLNWTGSGNYSFNLYDQDNTVQASSANKYVYAGVVGAIKEEFDETPSIGNGGLWTIEVKNNSAVTNSYTVKTYVYVNANNWLVTNFSSLTLNMIGNSNSVTNLTINFTVPSNTLDGIYEGYLNYFDVRGSGIKIPISVNVTAPMLVVNNSFNSLTKRIDQNYGYTLVKNFTFTLNNTGFYGMTINIINSSNLTCISSGCSGYAANLSYNPITTINNHNSQNLIGNISFNSSFPVGIYQGYIILNATDQSINLTSHPYSTFTINLILNLTDLLDVRVLQIISAYGSQTTHNSSAENVTAKIGIYYLDGTSLDAPNNLTSSNFNIWLIEKNTSYRIPTTGSLSLYNGTNPIYISYYFVNFTVPSNSPGGQYEVHSTVNWINGSKSFAGVGSNGTLIVNNTGLYMSTNTSTNLYLDNVTPYVFFTNITNYGPIAASSATIQFSESCSGYSVAATATNGGCNLVSYPGSTFTISPSGYSSSCLVWWTISPTTGSGSASACVGNIVGTPAEKWFDPGAINVTVTVTAQNSSSGSTLDQNNENTNLNYVTNLAFVKAESLITLKQNTSNSTIVQVKNTGNLTQNVTLSILNLNPSWYGILPKSSIIRMNDVAEFLVTFSAGNADIRDYAGTFQAASVYKNITSSFTLRVLPSDSNKTFISNTIAAYKQNLTDLSTRINQSKSQGYNTTSAESKYYALKTNIDQANNYIANGDYFNAYQLLSTIKNLQDQVNQELANAKKLGSSGGAADQITGYITYILIGVGVAGAIVLVYLFWPTKGGYKPKEKSYIMAPKNKQQIFEKLKERWDSLNKKKKEVKKEATLDEKDKK